MPIKYEMIPEDAKTTETVKVTKGFFLNGVGNLTAATLTTSSLSSTQKDYYYNMQQSSKDIFSVGYAHFAGSGSMTSNDTINGKTEVLYKQICNLVLFPDEAYVGMTFTGSSTDKDNRRDDFYFMIAERSQMKDRVNKGNWTVQFSGSWHRETWNTTPGSSSKISLTDDSSDVAATATPAGPRYNIVSGALGTVNKAATQRRYGYFYPNLGLWVYDVNALTQSTGFADGVTESENNAGIIINGTDGYRLSGSNKLLNQIGRGLKADTRNTTAADNAFKFGACLAEGTVTMRSEEDVTKKTFFCRAKAGDFNFSGNPTFITGSDGELYQATFEGNPQTFITTVGLYDNSQNLVAVGRLSKPVEKNYSTEATFKVNLDY